MRSSIKYCVTSGTDQRPPHLLVLVFRRLYTNTTELSLAPLLTQLLEVTSNKHRAWGALQVKKAIDKRDGLLEYQCRDLVLWRFRCFIHGKY